MGEIVNLRMARKRKARDDRERQAAENRVVHGVAKAEKSRADAEKHRAAALLDGHRLDPDDGKVR